MILSNNCNSPKTYVLEVCVDSVESALNAERGGADRLELCADLIVGGVTPSLALFERVREKVNIPIHVLLRPRFGDFLYSGEELEILVRQASLYRDAGADALVIGCLTKEGRLDMEANERIIEAVKTTPVNLHRAFDMCRDLDEALDDAKKLRITSILTSGGCSSALEGLDTLNHLKRNSGKIDIMAGAGVNPESLRYMKEHSCLTAFHMSGKSVLQSQMEYRNPKVSMGLPSLSEYEIWQTDEKTIRKAKNLLIGQDS